MTAKGLERKARRLVVTGGGTGGHVYPALAVVAAWLDMAGPEARVAYLGAEGGIEERLAKAGGIAFAGIESGPLRGKDPLVIARSVFRLVRGLGQAWEALGRFRPEALLATGGYVSVPVALAARLRGVPVVVYLPDIEPGWAVRALAPLARRIAVTSESSRAFLPDRKVVVTGYPARQELYGLDKTEARRRLGLDESLPTLLVMGGSRGANSINRAVGESMSRLVNVGQVIHICGKNDEQWLRDRASRLGEDRSSRYALHSYLDSEFPWALAAADLALSRAGASVMGEYPAAGLPSILVPYPHAGSHQNLNAQYLVDSGAAIVLRNGQSLRLENTAVDLLKDPERLAQMASQARALGRPDAAWKIASLLLGAEVRNG